MPEEADPDPENRHSKLSAPKTFAGQSTTPSWAWSSLGLGMILQAIGSYENPQARHSGACGSESFW